MKIFFSVGEPSADLHGANLMRAIRARRPDVEFVGYGGPLMAAAGCDLHCDLTALAVMWFLRVLLNLHKFLDLASRADRYFRHQRPDAVVLIDYPGFNWWIAQPREGARHSGLLLHAAADLGLGELARQRRCAASSTTCCAVCRSRKSGFASTAATRHSSAIPTSTKCGGKSLTRIFSRNSARCLAGW